MAPPVQPAPKLVENVDITRLPLGPIEGFVLSRIDGELDAQALASVTGLPYDEVARILRKLADLGAVHLPGEGPRRTASGVAPAVAGAVKQHPPSAPPPPMSSSTAHPDLDSPSDLEQPLREKVLATFQKLDALDHYELLGVPRTADRKAVKSAYYALAATFHTDRYFGKNLGIFKPKMEQIFARITQAHDTLANKNRREEYDAFLVDRDRTRAFEQLFNLVERGDVIEPPPAATAKVPAPKPSIATATTEPMAVPAPVAAPPVSATVSISLTPEEERARREALARRLGRGSPPPSASKLRSAAVVPAGSSTLPSFPPSEEEARLAAAFLRRRYEETVEASKRAQMRRFLDAAEAAMANDDVVAAANHYRLALQVADDPPVREAYEEATRRARKVMAEAYLKQARYEESSAHWAQAALAYAKASEGRPEDASIMERAANALRMDAKDLHRAARFAEAAVMLEPQNARYRATLGAVYLDAGLALRARSELELALKHAPEDAAIKDLLARARQLGG